MVIRLGIIWWRVKTKERVAVVIVMKKRWNKIREDGETKCRNKEEAQGAMRKGEIYDIVGICYLNKIINFKLFIYFY